MTLIGRCDAFDAIRRTAGQVVSDLTTFRRMTPALRLRHARPLADALDAYALDLRAFAAHLDANPDHLTPPTPKGEA